MESKRNQISTIQEIAKSMNTETGIEIPESSVFIPKWWGLRVR